MPGGIDARIAQFVSMGLRIWQWQWPRRVGNLLVGIIPRLSQGGKTLSKRENLAAKTF
jgi:hypothetical protein